MGLRAAKSLLVAVALAPLVGCSSAKANASSATFPAAAYATFTTNSGVFNVSLWTAPEQPPSRGVNRVKLEVTDAATESPMSGLDIAVVPWMPAMGHGTSVVPTVTDEGGGVYIADNVNFFMPANWQLRMTFSSHADGAMGVTDSATPSFDIP